MSKADLDPAVAMNNSRFNNREQSFASPDQPLNEPFLSSQGDPYYFRQADMQFPLEDEEPYGDRFTGYRNGNVEHGIHSPPTSQFGSPPKDNHFPKSPVIPNMSSALDAPLPASFNANSPSYYQRFGPLGQSVPDKFGFQSPPSSVLSQKIGSPPSREPIARPSNLGTNVKTASPLAASPANAEVTTTERLMHSQRGATRPKMISASVPSYEWDNGLAEDAFHLPSGIHEDVLTPSERMRRLSRPDQELSSSAKDRSEGLAIPRRSSGLVGSPPAAGSPSRFRAIFEEQQREKSMGAPAHIGSPLRESWMPNDTAPIGRPGPQMSGITQAMARVELSRTDSAESNSTRMASAGLRGGIGRFDRTISSPGLPSQKINEENEAIFFPMDDENSKRAGPHWLDNQGSNTGDKENDDSRRGLPFGKSPRPVFGFQS